MIRFSRDLEALPGATSFGIFSGELAASGYNPWIAVTNVCAHVGRDRVYASREMSS